MTKFYIQSSVELLTDTKTSTIMNTTDLILDIAEELVDIAKKRGEEKGLRKGLQRGLHEGLQKGRREGEQKKAFSIARQLKALGVSVEIIHISTGLSFKRIKTL